MKSVLISLQPYWVFLIIAKAMGWNINKEKTVEVRKNYPKADNWNKTVKIYCSKDKKSFAKIPKKYQPFMQQFLGKVIGEFVCDWVVDSPIWRLRGNTGFLAPRTEKEKNLPEMACLSLDELKAYVGSENKCVCGWHITDLVIYDKPKELSEFWTIKCTNKKVGCSQCYIKPNCIIRITRPPQSWCYVEETTNS